MDITDGKTTYVLPLEDMDFDQMARVNRSRDRTVPLWSNRRVGADCNNFCEFNVYAENRTEKPPNNLEQLMLRQPVYKCSICNVNVPKSHKKEHNASPKHKICLQLTERVLERSRNLILESDCDGINVIPGTYFCEPCAMSVKDSDREKHELTRDHYKSILHDKFLNDLLLIYLNKEYLEQMDFEYFYEKEAIEALIKKDDIGEDKHHETYKQSEENKQEQINIQSEDNTLPKNDKQSEIDKQQKVNKWSEYNKQVEDYKQYEVENLLEINKWIENNIQQEKNKQSGDNKQAKEKNNKQSWVEKQTMDYKQFEIDNQEEINKLIEAETQQKINHLQETNNCIQNNKHEEMNKQSMDSKQAKNYKQKELIKDQEKNNKGEVVKQLKIHNQSELGKQKINTHSEVNKQPKNNKQDHIHYDTNKQSEVNKQIEKNLQSEVDKQNKLNKQNEAIQLSVIKEVEAKKEKLPDDKPIPLEEYVKMITKDCKTDPIHKLKAENGFIIINTIDNMHVKVPPEYFHGYYTRNKHTQCRVCMVMVNGQKERHKINEEHIKKIMSPLKTSHCMRQIGSLLHHCIICNEIFANTELHENSNKHNEQYDKALSFAHSKYCAKCGLYCNASEKTYNMNYRLLKASMADFNEIIKDNEKKYILNCQICDLCLNNYAQCVEFEIHKSRLQSFKTNDSAGVQLKLNKCKNCIRKMRRICPH